MVIDVITQSRSIFFFFVEVCNHQYRSGHDLDSYREIIDMHKKSQNIVELIRNDTFCRKIYGTLEAWNMNQRGARLQEFGIIEKSLRQHEPYLIDLYKNSLDSMSSIGDENGGKVIRDLEFAFAI
jgi:hypothetical protein